MNVSSGIGLKDVVVEVTAQHIGLWLSEQVEWSNALRYVIGTTKGQTDDVIIFIITSSSEIDP